MEEQLRSAKADEVMLDVTKEVSHRQPPALDTLQLDETNP
jgi:hypothetical protein